MLLFWNERAKQPCRIVCPAFNSPVSTCQCVFGTEKFSSVSEERNKNAEGLNNKATELLVCPGGRGRYRGILSLKKPLQSANGVTKDSVGKALLLSVNRELVLETCVAATRRWWAGPKQNILCFLALVSCHASSITSFCLLACLLICVLLLALPIHPIYPHSLLFSLVPVGAVYISFLLIAQAPTHSSLLVFSKHLSGFSPIPSPISSPCTTALDLWASAGLCLSVYSDPRGQGGGCCCSSPANVSSLLTVLWWEVALNKRAPNPSVWFHPITLSQWEGSFLLSLCCRFLTHHTREKKRLWCLPSP